MTNPTPRRWRTYVAAALLLISVVTAALYFMLQADQLRTDASRGNANSGRETVRPAHVARAERQLPRLDSNQQPFD